MICAGDKVKFVGATGLSSLNSSSLRYFSCKMINFYVFFDEIKFYLFFASF